MRIREVKIETDCAAIVGIWNKSMSIPVTEEELRQAFRANPPNMLSRRIVAEDETDRVIGYAQAICMDAMSDSRPFWVTCVVEPKRRRNGIGGFLYETILTFLEEKNAGRLMARIKDDDNDSLAFVEKRGFKAGEHLFASELDVESFDSRYYDGLIEKLRSEGIKFFDMSGLMDDEEAKNKLFELNLVTSLDIPGAENINEEYEDFERKIISAKWFNPEGEIIAADGDAWVGISGVRLYPKTKKAYNLMTGVIKPYRGKKIAQALKCLVIEFAKKNGIKTISTHNNSLNIPMLAVNAKLGYKKINGEFIVCKNMQSCKLPV